MSAMPTVFEATLNTIYELSRIANRIREDSKCWKKYQDGSYEMALENEGYYTLRDTINTMKKRMMSGAHASIEDLQRAEVLCKTLEIDLVRG